MYNYEYKYKYECVYIYIYIHTYIHGYLSLSLYIYIHIHMCIHMTPASLLCDLHAGLACPFARHATSRSLSLLGLEGPWPNIGFRVPSSAFRVYKV